MSKKAATFTTHLLDSGTDLRYTQEMLGQLNSRTTGISMSANTIFKPYEAHPITNRKKETLPTAILYATGLTKKGQKAIWKKFQEK
jgi:hypothetical protein